MSCKLHTIRKVVGEQSHTSLQDSSYRPQLSKKADNRFLDLFLTRTDRCFAFPSLDGLGLAGMCKNWVMLNTSNLLSMGLIQHLFVLENRQWNKFRVNLFFHPNNSFSLAFISGMDS